MYEKMKVIYYIEDIERGGHPLLEITRRHLSVIELVEAQGVWKEEKKDIFKW